MTWPVAEHMPWSFLLSLVTAVMPTKSEGRTAPQHAAEAITEVQVDADVHTASDHRKVEASN